MAVIKDKIDQRRALREATRAGQPVVITIARDFGAEGHEIGKMLSCELGIPLYDNELLVRSALREGESLDKMAAYDEQLAMDNVAFLPDRVDSRSLSDKLFKSMSIWALRAVVLSRVVFPITFCAIIPITSPCW